MPDPVLPPFPTDQPLAPEADLDSLDPGLNGPKRYPALVDAWPWARPFELSGGVERGQFHPLFAALLVFIGAFLVFNVVGAIVVGVGLVGDIMESGGTMPDMEALLVEKGGLFLTSNTFGQWIGFALIAALMARWSTPDWKEFLRSRRPDMVGLGVSAVGWAVLYPLVLWLGEMNAQLPLPESLRKFDAAQSDMMETLLMGLDLPVWFMFLAIAITPAVCEELIFRGYLQRQVERGLGVVWSIVLVGVLFGLYHLQLTKAVPLAALGIYLGFVVWATGSVWTGALVHLLNNGFAVIAVTVARSSPDVDMEALESMGIPWYLALVSALGTLGVVSILLRRRRAVVGDTEDARPVALTPTSPPASPSYV